MIILNIKQHGYICLNQNDKFLEPFYSVIFNCLSIFIPKTSVYIDADHMLSSFENTCKFFLEQASQQQNDCESVKVSSTFLDKSKSGKITKDAQIGIKSNGLCLKSLSEFIFNVFKAKISGLSSTVKRYYIQDYPEYFRGNTEAVAITSDFL